MNTYKIEVTTFEKGSECFHIYEIDAGSTSEAVHKLIVEKPFRNIENISVVQTFDAVS